MSSYVNTDEANGAQAQAEWQVLDAQRIEAYAAMDENRGSTLFDAYQVALGAYQMKWGTFQWRSTLKALTGIVDDGAYTAQDAQDGLAKALKAYAQGIDGFLRYGDGSEYAVRCCRINGWEYYVTQRDLDELKALADMECDFYIA